MHEQGIYVDIKFKSSSVEDFAYVIIHMPVLKYPSGTPIPTRTGRVVSTRMCNNLLILITSFELCIAMLLSLEEFRKSIHNPIPEP
jgi:hypothetical protein